MSEFTVIIKTNNAAFKESKPLEVARILRRMAEELERGFVPNVPRDINGNKCRAIIIEGDW